MSPEIFDGKYSNKCDIWSVGILAYQLCKLDFPFKGSNLFILISNIKKGIYEPIQEGYSEELKTFISQCLKIQDERPTASELL